MRITGGLNIACLIFSLSVFNVPVHNFIVGVDYGEGPPVPVSNTEVKLAGAENTCLATDWEDRLMLT